mgnify:CR=1 FL=1
MDVVVGSDVDVIVVVGVVVVVTGDVVVVVTSGDSAAETMYKMLFSPTATILSLPIFSNLSIFLSVLGAGDLCMNWLCIIQNNLPVLVHLPNKPFYPLLEPHL